MLTIFWAIAAAYLFGLGIIGSVFIKILIQIKREHGKLNGMLEIILTGFHFSHHIASEPFSYERSAKRFPFAPVRR